MKKRNIRYWFIYIIIGILMTLISFVGFLTKTYQSLTLMWIIFFGGYFWGYQKAKKTYYEDDE